MADDTTSLEDYQNTFKARAKAKLKQRYIEGNNTSVLDAVADKFRKDAERAFTGDALEEHLQYVDLLVDAGSKADEAASYSLHDPGSWDWSYGGGSEDRERDGELFERAIDELRGENG